MKNTLTNILSSILIASSLVLPSNASIDDKTSPPSTNETRIAQNAYINIGIEERKNEKEKRLDYIVGVIEVKSSPRAQVVHSKTLKENEYFVEILDSNTNVIDRADAISRAKEDIASGKYDSNALYLSITSFKNDNRIKFVRINDPENNYKSPLTDVRSKK